MTHELDIDRTRADSQAVDHDVVSRTIGRSSKSAAFQGPTHPIVSGILMRKASGDALADDAESAVARASGGGGQALPDELRARFEGSLGTDLSDVRLHTDAPSQDAASAVSAKAYTIGNDIHFAAGQYDAGSTDGQTLLAHEVAHTVQQRGGQPHRQNKLAISQASDSFEQEADRAASAMVAGRPASVGGSGILLARKASAPAAPAGNPAGKAEETDPKETWPTWKDTSVSVPIWPALGASVGFDWGENAKATIGMEGELKKKLAEKKYTQSIQIAPAVTGSLVGSVSAGLFAKAEASAEGAWSEDGGKDKKKLTKTFSGGGSAGMSASGSLQVSVGAGLANVLAIEGGVKGTITASAGGSVDITGTMVKHHDGKETGSTVFTAKAVSTLSANAALVVDVVVPGDRINAYSYTLGKVDLATATLQVQTGYVNGRPVSSEPDFQWTILGLPKFEERTKRPLTAAEQKKYAPEVENGASGGSAVGNPDSVEMTDAELHTAGQTDAKERLAKMIGATYLVHDNDTAGLAMTMLVDGGNVRASMRHDAAARAREAEQGKKLIRVKQAQIVNFTLGHTTPEMVKNCAKSPAAVSRAILAQAAELSVVGTDFHYENVPPTICKKQPGE